MRKIELNRFKMNRTQLEKVHWSRIPERHLNCPNWMICMLILLWILQWNAIWALGSCLSSSSLRLHSEYPHNFWMWINERQRLPNTWPVARFCCINISRWNIGSTVIAFQIYRVNTFLLHLWGSHMIWENHGEDRTWAFLCIWIRTFMIWPSENSYLFQLYSHTNIYISFAGESVRKLPNHNNY